MSSDRAKAGFTLIELLVVMSIVALLVALALPRYFHSLDRSREAVLREDLRLMRESIDKFNADRGANPQTLDELVERRYLRSIPPDPITGRTDTWQLIAPEDGAGVADIRSGAEGNATDGTAFRDW